jgi:hypothetical protein
VVEGWQKGNRRLKAARSKETRQFNLHQMQSLS